MQVSFLEWDDSARARGAAASLGGDEVQVWTAAIPADEADLAAMSRMLGPAERERAERFLVPHALREFVFGHFLVRQLVSACANLEAAAIAFGAGRRGKLFLEAPAAESDLRFNLSHSHGLVAVVLARGREVGVDVESVQRLSDWSRLARRIFSPAQLEELHSFPESQRREAFFNGWTRKEAYLKATGEGLNDELQGIEVEIAPGREARLRSLSGDAAAAQRWSMRTIPLPRDFAGAVVFETTVSSRTVR